MNSLLKRQIRKYLPKELQENEKLKSFIDAVNKSYNNSDEQFLMLQRATAISSEELFEASEKLKEETNTQKKIIEKLQNVIKTLKVYQNDEKVSFEYESTFNLVDVIDQQTQEIIKISQQKDTLLNNLEEHNQELNDFTHMISHDLISPLQSIEALTQWLIDDYKNELGEEGTQYISQIKEHIEKIDILISSIRKYSRISRSEKNNQNLDLNHLLDGVLKELPLPQQINIHIPKKLPTVFAEKYSFKELFSNLISNALQFNSKDEKRVEIGVQEKGLYWEFYVKDNGDGIEERFYDKVFIAFSKLENIYMSAGMGLSIAKKIVSIYNGEIWIKSKLDIGTTVYFTIKK